MLNKKPLLDILENDNSMKYRQMNFLNRIVINSMYTIDTNIVGFFLGLISSVAIEETLKLLEMKVVCGVVNFIISTIISIIWLSLTFAGAKLLSNFAILSRLLDKNDYSMNVKINILCENLSDKDSNISVNFDRLSKTVMMIFVISIIAILAILSKFILVNKGIISYN